ncbi:Hypothetical_protein [Hexamita inflata]|uniref:Hypothetical_protein n=1 Tax=Hexamita inflata TaxID=28002 RepID=A0AA86NJ68_9EUKA|nr:Hypothetical protein HINF_LOCUS8380 [Hexamita inflata]
MKIKRLVKLISIIIHNKIRFNDDYFNITRQDHINLYNGCFNQKNDLLNIQIPDEGQIEYILNKLLAGSKLEPEYTSMVLIYLDLFEMAPEHIVIDKFNFLPLLFVIFCLISKLNDDLYVGLHDYQKLIRKSVPIFQYCNLARIEGFLLKSVEYHVTINTYIWNDTNNNLQKFDQWDQQQQKYYCIFPLQWHIVQYCQYTGI